MKETLWMMIGFIYWMFITEEFTLMMALRKVIITPLK